MTGRAGRTEEPHHPYPCPLPAFVLPKAEVCVRNHVQPYISSILEALMTPTSQGFAEVREVFFKEVTDMNMNVVNEGGLEKLVEVRAGGAPCWLGGDRASPAATPVWAALGDSRLRRFHPCGVECPWPEHVERLSLALSPVHGEALPPGLPPREDAVVL